MIVAAFPGQGAQRIGMAEPVIQFARDTVFAESSNILGYDLLELIMHGEEEQLQQTTFSQPALFVTCYAFWLMVQEQLRPDLLIGHSLGEITALAAAGSISFADGVRIVQRRGQLMDEVKGGGMTAVLGLDADTVESLCLQAQDQGWVQVANFNAPGQIIVSGTKTGLAHLDQLAVTAGAKRVVPLKVSGPFHSQMMQPAAAAFRQYLKTFQFFDPSCPVVSNHKNSLLTAGSELMEELTEQLTNPVRWVDNISLLEDNGVHEFVEVGPGNTLVSFSRRISKAISFRHCLN